MHKKPRQPAKDCRGRISAHNRTAPFISGRCASHDLSRSPDSRITDPYTPSQDALPMTGFRLVYGLRAYSGGTVPDFHRILYSPPYSKQIQRHSNQYCIFRNPSSGESPVISHNAACPDCTQYPLLRQYSLRLYALCEPSVSLGNPLRQIAHVPAVPILHFQKKPLIFGKPILRTLKKYDHRSSFPKNFSKFSSPKGAYLTAVPLPPAQKAASRSFPVFSGKYMSIFPFISPLFLFL